MGNEPHHREKAGKAERGQSCQSGVCTCGREAWRHLPPAVPPVQLSLFLLGSPAHWAGLSGSLAAGREKAEILTSRGSASSASWPLHPDQAPGGRHGVTLTPGCRGLLSGPPQAGWLPGPQPELLVSACQPVGTACLKASGRELLVLAECLWGLSPARHEGWMNLHGVLSAARTPSSGRGKARVPGGVGMPGLSTSVAGSATGIQEEGRASCSSGAMPNGTRSNATGSPLGLLAQWERHVLTN